MAQPKNRGPRHGEEDKDPERAARRAEFENFQKKADAHVQKRNELNEQARAARAERDLLHSKQKEFVDAMNQAKDERDGLNGKLREAKDLRAQFQTQAKEIIAKKRARHQKDSKEPGKRSPNLHAQELLAEINDLEFSQQTRVLSVAQENELLKQMRAKRAAYEKVKKDAEKHKQLKIDLTDLDAAIDELFKKAEEQHQIVLALHKQSNDAHERFVKALNDLATLRAEANKHHKHFLELREKSDVEHQAFLEVREKMLELKGKEFADRREAREIIREQRGRVRDAVANPRGLDQHAESALDKLKKGGKITLGS
jgi:uncharacterized coiled-coil DUF342 family protein